MTLVYRVSNAAPRAKITHQSQVKYKTSRSLPLPPSSGRATRCKTPYSDPMNTKTRDNSTQTFTPPTQNRNVSPALQTPNAVADDEPTPGELAFLAEMAYERERSRARWKAVDKACAWIFFVFVVAGILRALYWG
jgi:hypothetical protein